MRYRNDKWLTQSASPGKISAHDCKCFFISNLYSSHEKQVNVSARDLFLKYTSQSKLHVVVKIKRTPLSCHHMHFVHVINILKDTRIRCVAAADSMLSELTIENWNLRFEIWDWIGLYHSTIDFCSLHISLRPENGENSIHLSKDLFARNQDLIGHA